MIEWKASEALNEAPGKLMFTSLYQGEDENIRETHFISSLTKTPGLRYTEVLMGNDKVIPLSRSITFSMTSRDIWTIEKFSPLPYLESLNIENNFQFVLLKLN